MSDTDQKCHGHYQVLVEASEPDPLPPWRRLLWQVKNRGFGYALGRVLARLRTLPEKGSSTASGTAAPSQQLARGEELAPPVKRPLAAEEVLDLQPGELVEVRSEEEILATLDPQGRQRGLSWMPNMGRFCGKRFRVFKRLERILLESTGEFRNIKNTVLLEDVLCDGEGFYGCSRSCFHYWREVWLKRVEE